MAQPLTKALDAIQGDLFSSDGLSRTGPPSAVTSFGTSFPFNTERQTFSANAARIAGRLNAAQVSNQEHDELLAERQQLLDKKFEGKITKKEETRLQYVRWSLDRIEDAKHGHTLDELEHQASQLEELRDYIERFQQDLQREASRRR